MPFAGHPWEAEMSTATVGTERLNSHTVIPLEGYTAIAKMPFMILNVYFCYAYQILPGCPARLPSLLSLAMSWSYQPLGKLTLWQHVYMEKPSMQF